MVTEDLINQTISETAIFAAQENWPAYRDGITQLAQWYKTMQSQSGDMGSKAAFVELCKYIEQMAVNMTGDEFIRTKIKAELKHSMKSRIIH